MRKVFVIISVLFFTLSAGFGQHFSHISLGFGKVIKHKEELTFNIPDRSYQIQLGHRIKLSGSKFWHRFYGMPSITQMYQVVSYGDAEVLGNGHALLRGIDFSLFDVQKFSLNLSMYTGLGYVTKTYDRIENPLNNAIGSHLNNATRLGTSIQYSPSSKVDVSLSAHLLHFSNGLSQSPNSGINSWGIGLDLGYRVWDENQSDEEIEYAYYEDSIHHLRPWFLDLNWQYSRSEQAVPGGPKYPNHVFSIGGGWRYHRLLSLVSGVDYEYRSGQFEFFIRDFLPEKEARELATRTAFFIANDFQFEHIVLRPQVGYYLPYPISSSEDFYIKLGTYFQFPRAYGMTWTVGVVLKTHYAVAEYVAFSLGLKL